MNFPPLLRNNNYDDDENDDDDAFENECFLTEKQKQNNFNQDT